ncbi:hypothetical protein QE394_000862 [Arthrobacter sp. SORGH_AS 212]|uniref:hypothetical protein n=1 Tax=Pseudarthrobacter sp. SORGH_AS 212 TaxID=3041777 RepID=UPI00277D2D60|nr:hypothetical protein [Arthrobacter sp. SORGH_AS_0212]
MINISDLRHSSAKWALVVVVPLTWLVARSIVWDGLAILDNGVQSVVASVTIAGPLLGAVAAWDAARIKRHGLEVPWRASTIGAWRASLSVLMASCVWSAAAYCLIGTAVLVPMGLAGAAGEVPWLWLLCGLAGLTVQVGLGHTAGTVLPYKLTAALTGPGLYALVLVFLILNAQLHERFLFLSPTVQQSAEPYFGINNELLIWQGAWYLGLLAVIVGALSMALEAKKASTLAVIAGGLVMAGVGATGVFTTAPGFLKVQAYSVSDGCKTNADLTLCLHPSYESVRGPITAALTRMQEKLAGTPLGFEKVEVRNRGAFGTPEDPTAAVMHVDDLTTGWQDRDRTELALNQAIKPSGPCVIYGMETAARSFHTGFGQAVLNWSMDKEESAIEPKHGQGAVLQAFDAIPDNDKAQWITTNMKKICTDSVSASDFE